MYNIIWYTVHLIMVDTVGEKNKAKHGKMRCTPKTVKIATSEIQYLNF